jgi:hypothetical protein
MIIRQKLCKTLIFASFWLIVYDNFQQREGIYNHLGLGYVNHMKKSTKSRLTEKQIAVFPGNTLFDKIARAVCRAGTLPGKELFEAWEGIVLLPKPYRKR